MKRRIVIGVVILAALTASLLVVWWYVTPRHRVNEEGYDAIRFGMTEGEVEGVLGVPAGDYSTAKRIYTVPNRLYMKGPWDAEPSVYPQARAAAAVEDESWQEWTVDEASIEVTFDPVGRVVWKRYFESDLADQPSVFQRLFRRFGF